MLSSYEKETIIIGNEEDNAYTVYTYNDKLKRGLQKLAKEYPKLCAKSGEAADGGTTWRILKENLAISPVKPEAGRTAVLKTPKTRRQKAKIEENIRK